MIAIHNILVPIDFSRSSKHAFRLASAIARDYKARMILLHVDRDQAEPSWSHSSIEAHAADEAERQAGKDELKALCESARGALIEGRTTVGLPADEILRVAEEAQSDLIVMGSHGRKGIDRLLVGSVAEDVLRRAACPVLIARVPVARHALDEHDTFVPSPQKIEPSSAQACECVHPSGHESSDVLVSHKTWGCMTCPVTHVHHREFPDIVGEGSSVTEGIEHLVFQLHRAREHFRGTWHNDAIDKAINDVACYRKTVASQTAQEAASPDQDATLAHATTH